MVFVLLFLLRFFSWFPIWRPALDLLLRNLVGLTAAWAVQVVVIVSLLVHLIECGVHYVAIEVDGSVAECATNIHSFLL